jgi:hypothetical protein
LQWAFKQTNKREAEDQMVRHIEEYDGMEAMAQAVPELMMTSSRFIPTKAVRPNLDFPGAAQLICKLSTSDHDYFA